MAPQEPVYWWLLATPACARTAVRQGTSRACIKASRTRFLSALPLASLALEDRGFALPRAEHEDEIRDGESAICAVVRVIATAEGCEPHRLPVLLYDVLNPDALNRLFRCPRGAPLLEGSVTFRYCGYDVTISMDRTITLSP
ncbi:HalOD1 output domain-containing protein [Halomarina salina]|uniref:HalOD1 output domain-containing protein n=1 Tax=Halomarina salina TaxID=1872699 RepID=A0ABD5RHD3_9EURY